MDTESADSDNLDTDAIPGGKLRLLCSYGGHIIPRPHDQSLCYVGGDTRIVVLDRHSSLSSLSSRLSRTLFHGRHFNLKYQLPDEDLDSLISVATDDDLENMIDEYDRTASASKPSRLRLFLFLAKPETAASMGSLLNDAKSESWFVDALNGAALLPRGLSDPAAIENMMEFESRDAELGSFNKPQVKNVTDVQSNLPDSPLVETNSSFGSSTSSPLMSNLPPLKVGVEDQFSAMTVATSVHTSDDDQRSDPMAVTGLRKPPLPSQQGHRKNFKDPSYSPLSPDSVASDNSVASANSFSRQSNIIGSSPNNILAEQIPQTLTNQFQHPQQQQQQQQFINTNDQQYSQHPATNTGPVTSSYYPNYPPQPPQQYYQQVDQQQYQMYIMPVPKSQPYNMTMQTPSGDGQPQFISTDSPIYQTAGGNLVQVQGNQFQQQFGNVNGAQMPAAQAVNSGNYYGVEPVYYAPHSVVPSQYQTMNPATAVVMLSQGQARETVDNTNFR